MPRQSATQLIEELLARPVEFHKRGTANALLQCFFQGEPLARLRPLLRDRGQPVVQCVAMFVVSELGKQAYALLDDVIPLLVSQDVIPLLTTQGRYLQYTAMGCVTVCTEVARLSEFGLVVKMLSSSDAVLRELAMQLMSRVGVAQLAAARTWFAGSDESSDIHDRGLGLLVRSSPVGCGGHRRDDRRSGSARSAIWSRRGQAFAPGMSRAGECSQGQ